MTIRSGVVFDEIYLEHETGQHIERKERLLEVLKAFDHFELWKKLFSIQPRAAKIEELTIIHDSSYLMELERFAKQGGGWWDMDTVISPRTVEAARFAAGGGMEAVKAVMEDRVDNALALVRPPGHHAEKARAMGFCLINNAAVAAQYAIDNFALERTAIIDWDVHHGNGTQKAFWERSDVLYLSCHQSPLFPGTGFTRELGSGKGEGYNVNVPLPRFTGDMGYYYLFKHLFEPVILEYKPELIIISAGFDAHFLDPVGSMLLTASGFAKLSRLVMQWAGECCSGRVVLMLEGGYSLEGLASGLLFTIQQFAKLELELSEEEKLPRNEFLPLAKEAVDKAIKTQKSYWPV